MEKLHVAVHLLRHVKQIRNKLKILKCGPCSGFEKISWLDRVKNEAVIHGVKEERNVLHTTK
jgi:hypothetical protein